MHEYSLASVSEQTAGPGGDFSRPRRMDEPLTGHAYLPGKDDSIARSSRRKAARSTRTSSPSIRSLMFGLGAILTLATTTASALPTASTTLASNTLKLPAILYTPRVHDLTINLKIYPDFPSIQLDSEPPNDHFSQQNIAKRQDDEAPPISTGKASPPAPSSTISARTATTIKVASSSATGATTITLLPEETNVSLPTPFEAMGNNFTTKNCPIFIKEMVKNERFKACLPFSTFLETSTSFFQMMKSPYQTTSFLDRSCAANTTDCATYLTQLAKILILPENCKVDYDELDPIVHQAHSALLAYLPLYSASCLRNDAGTGYCFADMAGNKSAWMDTAVYSLGIGKPLQSAGANETATSKAGQADGGPLPFSCGSCLQKVMGILNSAANSGQDNAPVRKVWKAGAQAVNEVCGAGWVNETAPEVAFSGSGERMSAATVLPLVVAVVAAVILF